MMPASKMTRPPLFLTWVSGSIIHKTKQHALKVTTTEAELFAIRCGISYATSVPETHTINVVTDSIHAAMRIFDYSRHPYQYHTIPILKDIHSFVSHHPDCHIIFWDCPSKAEWPPHLRADTDSKQQVPSFYHFPCKTSWDFCRKEECDSLVNLWKMYFQATDWKGRQFLDLTDDKGAIIEPAYTKGGAWLKNFQNSPSLCARATRMITNYAPTGEYRQRFFPNKPRNCPCDKTTFETREHIIFNCPLYDKSWRLIDNTLKFHLTFLELNPRAFCFQDNIS